MMKSPMSGMGGMAGYSMGRPKTYGNVSPPNFKFMQMRPMQPAAAMEPSAPMVPVSPWTQSGLPAQARVMSFPKAKR